MRMAVLLFISLFSALSLSAQPALDSEYFPKLGAVQLLREIDPGSLPAEIATGPNQSWNLEGIEPLEGAPPITMEYIDPAITPYAAWFGEANICNLITDTASYFAYFKADENGWDYLGVGTDFGPIAFNDPMTMLKPMNFGESFKDTAVSALEYPDFGYYQFITQQVWYRGYGTLKLPQGDFSQVILVESRQEEIDSLTIPSEGFYGIDTIFTTTWSWYKAGMANPLGTYSISSSRSKQVIPGEEPSYWESSESAYGQFDLDVVSGIGEQPVQQIGQMDVFPNPAQGEAWLSVESPRNEPDAQLALFDATGKMVRTERAALSEGQNRLQVRLDNLQAGLYTVSLLSGGQAQSVRVVVK